MITAMIHVTEAWFTCGKTNSIKSFYNTNTSDFESWLQHKHFGAKIKL